MSGKRRKHPGHDTAVPAHISVLLEAFWEQQESMPPAALDPAYRAATALLLGIGLRDRFGPEALADPRLCPIPAPALGSDWFVLDDWLKRAVRCFAQPGYHAFEALLAVLGDYYNWLEANPCKRTVDGRTYSCMEWAASSIRLPLHLDKRGRLGQLRGECLDAARTAGDWLTLGLSTLETWFDTDGGGGPPEGFDIGAIILATPYEDTPVERACMANVIHTVLLGGIGTIRGGRFEGAVQLAYGMGRHIATNSHDLGVSLFSEADRNALIHRTSDTRALFYFYQSIFNSEDPAVWEADILDSSRRYVEAVLRIRHLPKVLQAPSVLRSGVDFAFWAGLLCPASGQPSASSKLFIQDPS